MNWIWWVKWMPVRLCHCCTISSLAAMRRNPLIRRVAKFLRMVSWFIWESSLCALCPFLRSSLICSHSSSHPRTSSFAFGSNPVALNTWSILSSSPSNWVASLFWLSSSNAKGAHKELHEKGGSGDGSGDAGINKDGAIDGDCYDFCPLNCIFCLSSIFLFFSSLFGFSCSPIDGNRLFKATKVKDHPLKIDGWHSFHIS